MRLKTRTAQSLSRRSNTAPHNLCCSTPCGTRRSCIYFVYRGTRRAGRSRNTGMNIVDPSPEDVSMQEALQLLNYRSAKTLRGAVQDGNLPRRYIQTARGPALVFRRDELLA